MGGEEAVHTFTLNRHELQAFREKFPVLRDRDTFGMSE